MSDLPPPSPPSPEPIPPPSSNLPVENPAVSSNSQPEPEKPAANDDPKPKDSDEANLGLVMHLLPLTAIFAAKLPFVGIVAPLVLWLIKRDTSPYLDAVGKEVINFQINLGIAVAIGLVLCVFPGIAVSIAGLVMVIIGAVKTHQGEFYRFPWIIRLIK